MNKDVYKTTRNTNVAATLLNHYIDTVDLVILYESDSLTKTRLTVIE